MSAWKKACRSGNVASLQKSSASAAELAKLLPEPTAEVAGTWNFDVRSYLESDDWREELQAACAEIGHRVMEDGDTLVSPPLIVRAQPGQSRLLLGKVGWPALHPKGTAAYLKKLSEKSVSPAALQQFLTKIYNASRKVSRQANDYATFKDIYDLFCFAPGFEKENTKASFAQQIYALDCSEVRSTRDNKRFHLEQPSAQQKTDYSVIAEDGTPIQYYAIWFG